jgi:hypothetical protein
MRIGLCGLLVLRLSITNYGVVANQPAALFQPLSYMKLFDRMPSQELAATLQICGIVAGLVAALGLFTRVSMPTAFACSLVLNGMLNSTGKVIYNDVLLTLCLLLIMASGTAASEAWSVRGPLRGALRSLRGQRALEPPATPRTAERYGWPTRTAMIAIALAYFFAGFQKWRHSGLPWVTSDNLGWILYASSDAQSHPNHIALLIANRPATAHLFAGASLLLETSFPLVLFIPRLRWLMIPGVVAMHLGIRLALGLDYSAQWLTVLIVFINWPVVVTALGRAAARLTAPRMVRA